MDLSSAATKKTFFFFGCLPCVCRLPGLSFHFFSFHWNLLSFLSVAHIHTADTNRQTTDKNFKIILILVHVFSLPSSSHPKFWWIQLNWRGQKRKREEMMKKCNLDNAENAIRSIQSLHWFIHSMPVKNVHSMICIVDVPMIVVDNWI